MVAITFITSQGQEFQVDAKVGATVMETAVKNNVPGVEAECGGACSCATCHVYLDGGTYEKLGKPDEMEEDMLDFAVDPGPHSRLSCQIKVTEDLDGITVRIPASQG